MNRRWRRIVMLLLTVLSSLLCLLISPVSAKLSELIAQTTPAADPAYLMQQSQSLYESSQFEQAADLLQQASQVYQAQASLLRQALALSNLSLTYQQLGWWEQAEQAIGKSLALLHSQPQSSQRASVLAQVLSIQGRLYLAQGRAESALEAWRQAAKTYETINGVLGVLEAQINQAKALQTLGLYRRAIDLLNNVTQRLSIQPTSLTQAVALRSLSEALLIAGDLPKARQALEQSLNIAQSLPNSTPAVAAAYLELGNLTRAEATAALNLAGLTPTEANTLLDAPRSAANPTEVALQQQAKAVSEKFVQQTETALDWYQRAVEQSPARSTRIQAYLKRFALLVDTQRWQQARMLYPQIQTQLTIEPANRSRIYNQIELAQSLLKLERQANVSPEFSARLLATAHQQAVALKDQRAQSHALGTLGELYEATAQYPAAQQLTQQALILAQAINAGDVAYRWQWQLGRLLKAQGDTAGAIQAYREAVVTLQSLRNDLVAINRDVQFSFRERVEPVYRELVDLLLKADIANPDLEKLVLARDVIEGLQVAELDNFFREACLDTQFQLDRVVDQPNRSAAILYTIMLPNRLEVILKLPQRSLLHYSTAISQTAVETTVNTLLSELKRPVVTRSLKDQAQQMYNWLIRQAEADLQANYVSTLVFVLDGALRSVPMSVLHDGQRYLIEKYNIALAPGLQLRNPKSLQPRRAQALVAGLSEAKGNFPALKNVTKEIAGIQAALRSRVLLNQDFTRSNFQHAVDSTAFSIVHIATHGQFSSNAAETFILTWDALLNVNELSATLQTREVANSEPIELLVLSACQTAVGDRRATLGLAGVAVRAGARSTIASLWNLDDDSGALFMKKFYETLVSAPISKAEALRQTQQSLLADAQYQAPRFWAPYVLLGNWL